MRGVRRIRFVGGPRHNQIHRVRLPLLPEINVEARIPLTLSMPSVATVTCGETAMEASGPAIIRKYRYRLERYPDATGVPVSCYVLRR